MAQLAARAGTEASTINKLEKGKTKLTLEWISKVAEALDVRPEHIIANPDNQIVHVSWEQAAAMTDTVAPNASTDMPIIEVAGIDPHHHIALTVEGHGMNLIADKGSVIIVDLRDRTPQPGKDYLFKVGERAMFKRWQDNPPRLESYSSIPGHDTIFPETTLDVIGRVVKAIKEL